MSYFIQKKGAYPSYKFDITELFDLRLDGQVYFGTTAEGRRIRISAQCIYPTQRAAQSAIANAEPKSFGRLLGIPR